MKAKREHKTVSQTNQSEFDNQINSCVMDGWEVDSKSGGVTPDGYFFMAFLSREVAESPPQGVYGGGRDFLFDLYFHGAKFGFRQCSDDPNMTIGDFTAKVSAEFEQKVAVQREENPPIWENFQLPQMGMVCLHPSDYSDLKAKADAYDTYGPDLPRLYTYDEAWLIWEEGRDKWELSDKNGDSEAHFEKFLGSLGKKSPAPEIGENTPTERPSNDLLWSAFVAGYNNRTDDDILAINPTMQDAFKTFLDKNGLGKGGESNG